MARRRHQQMNTASGGVYSLQMLMASCMLVAIDRHRFAAGRALMRPHKSGCLTFSFNVARVWAPTDPCCFNVHLQWHVSLAPLQQNSTRTKKLLDSIKPSNLKKKGDAIIGLHHFSKLKSVLICPSCMMSHSIKNVGAQSRLVFSSSSTSFFLLASPCARLMVDFGPLCLFKIGSLLILDNEVGHKCAPGINETNVSSAQPQHPTLLAAQQGLRFPTLQVELWP